MTNHNPDWHCKVCNKYLFSTWYFDPSPDEDELLCREHKAEVIKEKEAKRAAKEKKNVSRK